MRPGWILRLVVSLSVLGLLLAVVPLDALWAALRSVPPVAGLLVLIGFLLGHAVAALKWRLLMGPLKDVPPALWLRAHFAGLVANLCLPGVAGGDVVRAGWVMRRVSQREDIAVASVADRGIDVSALVVLAFAGAVWMGRLPGPAGRIVTVGAGVMLVVALGTLVAAGVLLVMSGNRWPQVGRAMTAVRRLVGGPWTLAAALALSLLVQAGFVGINVWLGHAAGVRPGLGAWLLAWPLAKIVAVVPVSLAGLGVREAALVGLMRPFGASASGVLAVGLLWEAVLVAGGVVGWAVTLTLPREKDGAA